MSKNEIPENEKQSAPFKIVGASSNIIEIGYGQ